MRCIGQPPKEARRPADWVQLHVSFGWPPDRLDALFSMSGNPKWEGKISYQLSSSYSNTDFSLRSSLNRRDMGFPLANFMR